MFLIGIRGLSSLFIYSGSFVADFGVDHKFVVMERGRFEASADKRGARASATTYDSTSYSKSLLFV